MSLPNYLAKIKSAGIYRFVWDKSQVTATEAETLRLVVGYSDKGPFNTPVYIDNAGDFKTTFGDINKKLERRGCFFHRLALQALAAGPILALNLKKFKDEKVSYIYAKNAADTGFLNDEGNLNEGTISVPSIYNTSRFWSLDPDNLPDNTGKSDQYFVLTSTDSQETSNSVFVRGYAAPSSYNVTLKTWYKTVLNEDMPEYMMGYEDMLVSDFFAEIYVFKGKFTPALAVSEELKKYFDVKDDKVYLKKYITNAFGEKVDTLEALADNECSNFVQRYQGVLLPYFKDSTGSYISLDLLFNNDTATHKMMMKLNGDLLDDGAIALPTISTRGWDNVTTDIFKGMLNPSTATKYLYCFSNNNIVPSIDVASYDTDTAEWVIPADGYAAADYTDAVDFIAHQTTTEISGAGTLICPAEYYKAGYAEGDRFLVDVDGTYKVTTLSKIEYTYDNQDVVTGVVLTFANNKAKAITYTPQDSKDSASIYMLVKCNHIATEMIASMSPIYLEGYTRDIDLAKPKDSTCESKLKWQKEASLNAAHTDSSIGYPGLVEALTNRVDVDYRYIVDTFESFVDSEVKASLACLAKKKDNCLLLTNFPAVSSFIKCKVSTFTDDKGTFQTQYVVNGANRKKSAAVLFSLPTADNGASWCSFNTPVVFTDGTVKTVVPAAALVSNNFMEKYNSRQPYYIVAGPNYGRLTYTGMVGPDFNYSQADRDLLEPFGVNCTVYVPRKGTYINSNQTAKQTPVTALSKINVRELVIYLQDQIEDLLQNYQWEFNTQTLRDLIKAKADTICENVKNNGGIYAYENQCDENNNTDDVINNEMLVLSTSIEPGMGAGKMVQELTIYKKGGMTSTVQ